MFFIVIIKLISKYWSLLLYLNYFLTNYTETLILNFNSEPPGRFSSDKKKTHPGYTKADKE